MGFEIKSITSSKTRRRFNSAYGSESIRNNYNDNKYTIQDARKGRTSYFDPLDDSLFDTVFNPVVIEPTVQFTTYWKVKFEAGKRK